MTAETRREVGLNTMIGAGAIGGAAIGSPLGTALGMMAAGAQAPWGRLLVISAIAVPIALTVWLIGRAVWARAWRDIRRERAATVIVPADTFKAMQDPAPADAPGLRAMVARRDARNRASSDEQGQGKPETPGGKDHG